MLQVGSGSDVVCIICLLYADSCHTWNSEQEEAENLTVIVLTRGRKKHHLPHSNLASWQRHPQLQWPAFSGLSISTSQLTLTPKLVAYQIPSSYRLTWSIHYLSAKASTTLYLLVMTRQSTPWGHAMVCVWKDLARSTAISPLASLVP